MAVKPKKPTPLPPPDGDGYCVYLGPSIRGVVQSGTIFAGTRDEAIEALEEAVGKYPLISALIVPGTALAEARLQAKKPGNALFALAEELRRQIKA